MSEVLSSLKKKGGMNGIDITNPDSIKQGNISSGGTVTITVTKLPKYIILAEASTTTTSASLGWHLLSIYDVKNNEHVWSRYTNAGFADDRGTGLPYGITSVSSSSIVIDNVGNSTRRYSMMIYY